MTYEEMKEELYSGIGKVIILENDLREMYAKIIYFAKRCADTAESEEHRDMFTYTESIYRRKLIQL